MSRPIGQAERRVLDDLGSRDAAMRADLARWVAIPTGHNHAQGLDELRAILADRLRALGASLTLVPGESRPTWLFGAPADGGDIPPALVATTARDRGPRILVSGHLDTVFPPDGPFRAMQTSTDGRTATGPGVVDMKGGLVVAVHALEALANAGVQVNWTFILNSDEETGSYHSEGALRAQAARHDVGVALEPASSERALVVERGGSGQFMIEAFGRAAHVGRDFQSGVSAVHALARAIDAACSLADPANGRIVNVGPLRGGEATNVVPDHASAWGNVRFTSNDICDDLGRRIDALATSGDALPRIAVHRSFNRPPKPLTPQTNALALLARDTSEALGQELPFARTGGVCDGNILQDAGLPTLDTLGVRGGGLHTPSEWIDLPSLVDRSRLLALFLARLAGDGVPAPTPPAPKSR